MFAAPPLSSPPNGVLSGADILSYHTLPFSADLPPSSVRRLSPLPPLESPHSASLIQWSVPSLLSEPPSAATIWPVFTSFLLRTSFLLLSSPNTFLEISFWIFQPLIRLVHLPPRQYPFILSPLP